MAEKVTGSKASEAARIEAPRNPAPRASEREIDAYIEVCRKRPSPRLGRTFRVPPNWRFDAALKACDPMNGGKDAAEDQGCFWNLLATLMPRTPFSIPEGGPVRILDIGCGEARAARPTIDYFEGADGEHEVSYLGVDIEPRAVNRARASHWGCDECRFEVADATRFANFGRADAKFDVILMRHPGPMREPGLTEIWRKIAAEAMAHLSDDGVIIVTDYFCDEYRFMQHVLVEELGAVEYVSGKNPDARPFHQNLSRDNYVAIYGKAKR